MYAVQRVMKLFVFLCLGAAVPLFCESGVSSGAPEPAPAHQMQFDLKLPPLPALPDLEFFEDNPEDFPVFLALAEDEKVDIMKPDRNPGDREEHEERIALFRLWRIMNDVNLSDSQVDKFFPLMRKMQQREKEIAKSRRALLKGLQDELNKEKPAETALKGLMDQIKDNGHQSWDERKTALDQVAQFLTLEQQAKLVLSLNRVEKDIWETVARVRSMPHMGDYNFDRKAFRQDMDKVRQNLEKMKLELKEKGYPMSDFYFPGTGTPKDSTGKKK